MVDLDTNNRDDGPRFKEQCREASTTTPPPPPRFLSSSSPTESQQQARPPNKAQAGTANNNGGNNNTNEIQVPLAFAVAVDATTTNNTNTTTDLPATTGPSAAAPTSTASRQDNNTSITSHNQNQDQNQNSANSDAMVFTVSKKTLYGVLVILVVLLVGGGAAVAGVLASRRGSGEDGTAKSPTPGARSDDAAAVTTPSNLRPGPPPAPAPATASSPPTTPCSSDTDCPLNVCARASLERRTLVCCSSGAAVYLYSPVSDNVCTGQPVGAACTDDSELCAPPGVCVQNICTAGPLAAGAVCDDNYDCDDIGTCVAGRCIDGLLPINATCDDSGDCANGVCALETTAAVKTVCCPTGSAEYFSGLTQVCTGQVAGAACGSNDGICQSGSCFQGLCQAALQANGGSCDGNEDCIGACIGGKCTDGPQPAGATCDDSSDCANNVCALETAASAKNVCCPTGSAEYFSGLTQVCTGQATGAACGSADTLCQSGACYQGICLAALQDNGQPCDGNEDCTGTCVNDTCTNATQPAGAACDDNGDCANGVCAGETAASAKQVCCPTGESTFDAAAQASGYIVCTK